MILWEATVVVSHYWILKAGTFPASPPAPVRVVFHRLAPALSCFHILLMQDVWLVKTEPHSGANIITESTFKV